MAKKILTPEQAEIKALKKENASKNLSGFIAVLLAAAITFGVVSFGKSYSQKATENAMTPQATVTPSENGENTDVGDENATLTDEETPIDEAIEQPTDETGEQPTGEADKTPTDVNEQNKMPSTYAEILAAYTTVVNKVKIEKPGYTSNDYQELSNLTLKESTYKLISGLAGEFLETKDESTPGTHKKGGEYHEWFALPADTPHEVACVLKDTSKIQSASCIEKDGKYVITITLKKEKDPYLNWENPYETKSWHGQMFDVIDIKQVTDYAKKIPGVSADDAYCEFQGTAVLTYDPATNRCIDLDHKVLVDVYLMGGSARVIAYYNFYDFIW